MEARVMNQSKLTIVGAIEVRSRLPPADNDMILHDATRYDTIRWDTMAQPQHHEHIVPIEKPARRL